MALQLITAGVPAGNTIVSAKDGMINRECWNNEKQVWKRKVREKSLHL